MNEPDMTQPEGEAAAPTREQILSELAESTNQEFETAVASSSSRAFNLGCSLTLLPGIILVLLVFILSRANWAMTLVTAVLVTMVAAIFTIFVAQQTKTRSTERVYGEAIQPQLTRSLQEQGCTWAEFADQARQTLPPGALLLPFLESDNAANLSEGKNRI